MVLPLKIKVHVDDLWWNAWRDHSIATWMDKNVKGKWGVIIDDDDFYFEFEEDAVKFKLKWA